jgi:predicted alpha/beta-hydrolase family hydrolase
MAEGEPAVPLRFDPGVGIGPVSALCQRPRDARALYVIGHGAGAGMRHPFLEAISGALNLAGIATFRYQFPYMEEGRRHPDPPRVAQATVRAAVMAAARWAPELPVIAGGKSFGGRMTSAAQAESPLPGVQGLVFLGFPLHPPNQPGDTRARHLDEVHLPMLFLQGTRDDLADLELMRQVCRRLGGRATLHEVAQADHSFRLPKQAGRDAAQVIAELAGAIREWVERVVAPQHPAVGR